MRLLDYEMRGLTPVFAHRTIQLDLEALGPGIIALVGRNGRGKTTVIEGLGPMSLFRWSPYYKANFIDQVADDVTDAYQQLRWRMPNGDVYKLKIAGNAANRKTEALLWKNDEPLAGPLLGSVDAELAKIIPVRPLFLAGPFAPQGNKTSLFEIPTAERKTAIIKGIGLEHLQVIAEACGAREKQLLAEYETRDADRKRLQAQLETIRLLEEELIGAMSERDAAATAHAGALEAVTAARAARDKAHLACGHERIRMDAAVREHARLSTEAAALQNERMDVEARVAQIRGTLADDQKIRDAYNLVEAIDSDLHVARAALTESSEGLEAERRRANEALVEMQRADSIAMGWRGRYWDLSSELYRAREARRLRSVDALVVGITNAGLHLALTDVDQKLVIAGDLVDQQSRLAADKASYEQQIEQWSPVTGSLETIDLSLEICRACALTADAQRARGRVEDCRAKLAALPEIDTEAAWKVHEALCLHRDDIKAELAAIARDLVAASQPLPSAPEEFEVDLAGEQLNRVEYDLTYHVQRYDELAALVVAREAHRRERAAEVARVVTEREKYADDAKRHPALLAAQAAADQLGKSLASLTARAEALAGSRAALPNLDDTAALDEAEASFTLCKEDLDTAEAEVAEHEKTRAGAAERVANLTGARGQFGDVETELQMAEIKCDQLGREAADFSMLGLAFGRDGIQALELDAAGPAMQAGANDLLLPVEGGRFQVKIVTTEPTRKGVREVFDMDILDSRADQPRKKGSGGEMSLIDEAARLGLSLHTIHRSGFPCETLYRDETSGPLDPENVQQYLAMLRRAMELGKFHQLFLVSHTQAVWEACDRKIFFEDDHVRVQ